MRSFDVAVIGAGIVGAACARELAEAGLKTVVIESKTVGGGATGAAMGHIAVMDDSEPQFVLTRYSQLLWKNLAERLPADAEYFPWGVLWVAADDIEIAEVYRKERYYSDHQVPVEVLDSRSLSKAEPNLRPGLAGALLVKEDAVVSPPCVARFLITEAQQFGAELILGRRAVSIKGKIAMLDNGAALGSQNFVLANGASAPLLARGINVQPRKGHLALTDRYPGFVRRQLIELGYLKSAHASASDSVAFNVQPRPSGQLLIGSSRQYGKNDSNVDTDVISSILQRAIEYMPDLGSLEIIRSWAGVRAATPDKLPLIGPYPGNESVYVATGHEGLGITTSLGTAKLIADHLLRRKSAIDASPYLPDRRAAATIPQATS